MYLTISLLSLIGFMFVIEFSLYNPIFISVVVIISAAFSDITNFLSFWGLLKYHIVKIVKKIANDTKKIINLFLSLSFFIEISSFIMFIYIY